MQYFIDINTFAEFHFDDAVNVSDENLIDTIIPKPSHYHEWVDGEWVLILINEQLQGAIIRKVNEINFESLLAQYADVEYNGVTYQADKAKSYMAIRDAEMHWVAANNQLPDGFYWIAKDNSEVPFTKTDIKALANVVAIQRNDVVQKTKDKKDYLRDPARTLAEVEAVTWDSVEV